MYAENFRQFVDDVGFVSLVVVLDQKAVLRSDKFESEVFQRRANVFGKRRLEIASVVAL